MKRQRGTFKKGGLLKWVFLAGGVLTIVRLLRKRSAPEPPKPGPVHGDHYKVVVIGTGFGGSMAGLTVARALQARGRDEKLLMLERGVWWTTPVNTVEDKKGAVAWFLRQHGQPVQFWNSVDHFAGIFDLVLRCLRRPGNEDGLFAQTTFGRKGALGLSENDGVSIIGGNGVGGGSLVYSNVTVAPPDFVLDDPAWPVNWNGQRPFWYDLARDAIGYGVLYAWEKRQGNIAETDLHKLRIASGLSNLASRSTRINPYWAHAVDGSPLKRIDLSAPQPADAPDPAHRLWIDRARVFQTAMSQVTGDFGTVDSAIKDLPAEPAPFNPGGTPANYCERQGRCVLGCLPDARQTLSKQLMAAIFGGPGLPNRPAYPPLLPGMALQTRAEVEEIRARPQGGYEIHYLQRGERSQSPLSKIVTADLVILAAGCTGTNEILLRSRKSGGLPYLSSRLGFGFSTNGDSLQFLNPTRERTYLTRGPMMTSYGRFHTPDSGEEIDPARYHAIEDNGLPKVFANLVGVGLPVVRWFARGHALVPPLFLSRTSALWFSRKAAPKSVQSFLPLAKPRKELLRSEDEELANMLCVATMGRDQANGQFRLGDPAAGETTLRLSRVDGKAFFQDPIYAELQGTLKRFAQALSDDPSAAFENPFFELGEGKDALIAPVPLTHPLGGCRMAASPERGVVDEFGRVFKVPANGDGPYYKGLYVVDASIVPTALGINPTLTISALALRAADQIVKDWFPLP